MKLEGHCVIKFTAKHTFDALLLHMKGLNVVSSLMRQVDSEAESEEAIVTLDERFMCDTYQVRSKRHTDESGPSF